MSGFNGTGPLGQGGRTGRGMGRCLPAETIATEEGAEGVQENQSFAPENQVGMGRGFGMGRGRGGRGAGMGRGCGRGCGRGFGRR